MYGPVVFAGLLLMFPAVAQDIVGDMLSGKLVNPQVGQWAWYDVRGPKTNYALRQAVVGEESVDGKQAFWVEFEVVPESGYAAIYKMLLSGPASDSKNVHKILLRQGPGKPQDIPIATGKDDDTPSKSRRKKVGDESVETPNGPVETMHYTYGSGDKRVDIWVNEKVLPSGLVQLKNAEGQMLLRSYGNGGENAQSAIESNPRETTQRRVEVSSPVAPKTSAQSKEARP